MIAENLKNIRKDIGMTQKKLSELTGISYTYISRLETGAYDNPSLDVLEKLSDALGCKVEELTGIENANTDEIQIRQVVDELIRTNQLNYEEATAAGLMLLKLRKHNIVKNNFKITPKIAKLLEKAIQLDEEFDDLKEDQ